MGLESSPKPLLLSCGVPLTSKFGLYNYAGKPSAFYLVDEVQVGGSQTTTEKAVSHHIMIVDRSGSMYGDIEALKNTLVKVLTLEEYANAEMYVSLVSYSSRGDVSTHFERIKVSEIMKEGSKYVEEIRRIRATALTCVSQSLEVARKLVRQGETTCISLHSDGFANDSSPFQESHAIAKIVNDLKTQTNVFVNTIAYNAWSDFKLLSAISNSLSGKCVQATNIKQVYDALHDTSTLLAGRVNPAVKVPLEGGAEYQIFLTSAGKKLNGTAGELTISGVRPEDDKTVLRYRKVTEAEYNASPATEDRRAIYAFARAKLAEGSLNTAKYALVSSRNQTLLERHSRALTNAEIAAFSADLDDALFGGPKGHVYTPGYGLTDNKSSVLEIARVMNDHKSDISIDVEDLGRNYVRRGLRRVAGVRNEDGSLTKPWLRTDYADDTNWVSFGGFEINRNTATINMQVRRPVNLVREDDGTLVKQVAGIDLAGKLFTYNNYTVVGDGSLNLGHVKIRIASKKAFKALAAVGAVDGDFDPTGYYKILFDGRPLVSFNQTFASLGGAFEKLARFKVLTSVLDALLKEQSDTYTEGQIEELKRHYLSSKLYINFPTTNEYTSLEDALSKGEVDTRLSYKVDIGSTSILTLGKLHSANKFLDRLYTVTVGGKQVDKPNFQSFWETGVTFGRKTLSAKTKITAIDNFMKTIFDEVLGFGPPTLLTQIITEAGGASALATRLDDAFDKKLDDETAVEVFTAAQQLLTRASDEIYESVICPLVFYVGSTGLLPDDLDTKALTADAVAEKYPDLAIGKSEQEGTFFLVGDTVLSVYVKGEHFTTDRAAAAQSAALAAK